MDLRELIKILRNATEVERIDKYKDDMLKYAKSVKID